MTRLFNVIRGEEAETKILLVISSVVGALYDAGRDSNMHGSYSAERHFVQQLVILVETF